MIHTVCALLNGHRFLRFLLVGGANTLFGLAVYALSVLAQAPVWLALLIGVIAGATFNFVTTGGYVFRDLSLGRVPLFALSYLLIYGINLSLLNWILSWLNGAILAQAILVLPMSILSYTLMGRFVFTATRTLPKCVPSERTKGTEKSS